MRNIFAAYVALHQSMDHGGQKSSSYAAQEAEKYYAATGHPPGVSIRPSSHVPIHGGSIPVQQLPQVFINLHSSSAHNTHCSPICMTREQSLAESPRDILYVASLYKL